MKRNPKLKGSDIFDCIPQRGPCPNNCNQCYYNHNFYLPIDQAYFPTLKEVGNGIVRVNSGNDSNINRDYVIKSTERYPKRFFNTSIPIFNFPAPVVFTANSREEDYFHSPHQLKNLDNLMFIRLRVSSTNIPLIIQAIKEWKDCNIPIVLTFMRYYDDKEFSKQHSECYEYRKSILNYYWCPTSDFMITFTNLMKLFDPNIRICNGYCHDCGNCKHFYKEK